MIKNISFLIILFCSHCTYAKVTELDNHHIRHCQEQLKNNDWVRNVVMLYVKGSPGTKQFRVLYEQVATEYPQRHLFALNVFDPEVSRKENQLTWETIKACLTDMMAAAEQFMGNIGSNTPAILLYDYDSATVGLNNHGRHQLSTKENILEFIREKNSK